LIDSAAARPTNHNQTAKTGVDEDIPHLSPDLIGKCVSDLRLLNVLTE
jgi:hypothetical protein